MFPKQLRVVSLTAVSRDHVGPFTDQLCVMYSLRKVPLYFAPPCSPNSILHTTLFVDFIRIVGAVWFTVAHPHVHDTAVDRATFCPARIARHFRCSNMHQISIDASHNVW